MTTDAKRRGTAAPRGGTRRLVAAAGATLFALAGHAAEPPAAPAFKAAFEEQAERYQRDGVDRWRWSTWWVLDWGSRDDATGYEVAYKTAEGPSRKVARLDAPPFRLEVAKGDNPVAAGRRAREMQLLTIQGLLQVRVSARLGDGAVAPVTPWLMVGGERPAGEQVGHAR